MEIILPRPLEIARKVSFLSEFDKRFKMGAVITRKGNVIAVGMNKLKTAGAKYPNLFSVHAELSAIINAQTNLDGAYIWVYRETVGGIPALSWPCKTCFSALEEAGIKRIYYSIDAEPYYEMAGI